MTTPHDSASPRPRLGIYGGTFDPLHWGHLIGAQDALEQLQLAAVIFMPCRQSPHKLGKTMAAAEHRMAMVQLGLQGFPRFIVSRWEVDRLGPSYAIDTVKVMREAFPGADWYWIIGADQLPKLETWERYAELRQEVTFVCLFRSQLNASETASPRKGQTRKGADRSGVINLPQPRRIDISATEIRQRVKQQLPIHHLVPPAVADYIAYHSLYHS